MVYCEHCREITEEKYVVERNWYGGIKNIIWVCVICNIKKSVSYK